MDIAGTWTLDSFVAKSSDGAESFPWGLSPPRGVLIYTTDGYMSVAHMRGDRPKFASGDQMGGTPDEIKQAFEGFDAYSGTYEFDQANGTVTHHIKVARFPNWVDTEQVRYVRLVDGSLHLSTPPVVALGKEWVISLVWNKAVGR